MTQFGQQISGQADPNNESGARHSRFEIARNDIMNAFAEITTANGYRNDVAEVVNAIRAPFKITETPEIGVVMGTRRIKGEDQTWGVTTAECDIFVQAVVSEDESMEKASSLLNDKMESMAHDIARVIHGFFTSEINAISRGRWNILTTTPVRIIMGIDFGEKVSKGVVRAEFQIQLRSMDGTYD